MIGASPIRETREVLITRARHAMRQAEAETLPNRARIHMDAAETWLRLAARKVKPEHLASAEQEAASL